MIEPNNKRLLQFHFIVFVIFYLDFFLTGFILANFKLLNGDIKEDQFLSHHDLFKMIIIV